MSLTKELKDRALRCRETFPEQLTTSSFAEGQSLNVHDSKRMYCTEIPTIYLRQLAQYADIFMLLGGNRTLSLTRTALLGSSKRGGCNNCQQDQGRESFRLQRDEVHAIVTTGKSPSGTGVKATETNL